MGGKIECYVDCASPYSYFALKYLREQRPLLQQYDIEVEFYPFFLGAVNQATGNKPPSTLPAKAKFGPYDLRRACTFFNTVKLSGPPFFPMLSLLPQRCMVAIKSRLPREKYETTFESCWLYCFHHHRDLSKHDMMKQMLLEHLDEMEADEVLRLAGTKEVKDGLLRNTTEALERGAFGAPWFWVTNSHGVAEPVFGSDRWSYIFKFLGVEVSELHILDKSKTTLEKANL